MSKLGKKLIAAAKESRTENQMKPKKILKKIRKVFDVDLTNNPSENAYYNLMGAIDDIKRTKTCDEVSMKTLNRVLDQLGQVNMLLDK